jgi:hypothetical protein
MNPEARSLQKVQALAGAELSLKARLGYAGLLLVSAVMTTVVVSVWLTEPSLPRRTQISFGVLSVIGASWIILSLWALGTRRGLFARDRVIAGGMAVVFTSLFVAGSLVATAIASSPAAFTALGMGIAMLVVAITLLAGARRRFAALAARRVQLERELGA